MKHWFSPKMSWKTFKKLNDPFQGDIVPMHADRILWKMLRDREINLYLSDSKKDKNDPLIITTRNIKGGVVICAKQ